MFLLKDGPGPIQYRVNPDGTVPYTGASFSSRNATWRDPNLRNPYIMNWSAGFQFQPGPTWLVNAMYQGTAGVGLVRSWNINQIPLSIALGSDRALQDKVFASQQNYLIYPQFGTINYLSNFNHNTWHSGNFAVEKRYAQGLTLNATFNWSKSLSNDDRSRTTRGPAKRAPPTTRRKPSAPGSYTNCRSAKGQRWLNRGGVLNAILGGWKVDVSENILSGIPITVGYSGSPNKYLTAYARQCAGADRSGEDDRTGRWATGFQRRRRPLLRHECLRISGLVHASVRWAPGCCRRRDSTGCSFSPPRAGIRR